MKAAKSIFHVLTSASTVIAAYGALVPQKYAAYVAASSAVISAALHFIAQKYPAAVDAPKP